MKIKEKYDTPEDFDIPDYVDMWYDVHTKSWVL